MLKWKDGKKAVFFLMFDDSAPSAVKTVVSELKKRGMAGTFYVVPGGSPFKAAQKAWETELPGPGIVYANHTFSHKGATTTPKPVFREFPNWSSAFEVHEYSSSIHGSMDMKHDGAHKF